MKKIAVLIGLVCAAGLVAFMSLQPVSRIGPFFTTTTAWDTGGGGQTGGYVQFYKVKATDSLKIGDVVFLKDSGTLTQTVSKSITIANYNSLAGVVVGGTRTTMQAYNDSGVVGTLAGTGGQTVIVCRFEEYG